MLSTIGRAAIRRVGGGGISTSTNRAFQSLWIAQRADYAQKPETTLLRFFATATKSAAAPKAKSATKAAGKAVKPKAKTAAKKKAAPKKKVAVKKKKPVAKPTKKRVPLTEAQKLKAEIKDLKTKALLEEEPKALPSSAWNVVLTEESKVGGKSASILMPEIAAKYKNLSAEELEVYNQKAKQNKIASSTAHKRWVESHTPDEINSANNARRLLRKRTNTKKFRLIHDDRIPKRPTSAMFFFMKERYASGDLKGLGDVKAANALLINEWKALSEVQKEQYEDAAVADKTRYISEYKTVFKRDSTAKAAAV